MSLILRRQPAIYRSPDSLIHADGTPAIEKIDDAQGLLDSNGDYRQHCVVASKGIGLSPVDACVSLLAHGGATAETNDDDSTVGVWFQFQQPTVCRGFRFYWDGGGDPGETLKITLWKSSQLGQDGAVTIQSATEVTSDDYTPTGSAGIYTGQWITPVQITADDLYYPWLLTYYVHGGESSRTYYADEAPDFLFPGMLPSAGAHPVRGTAGTEIMSWWGLQQSNGGLGDSYPDSPQAGLWYPIEPLIDSMPSLVGPQRQR